MENYRTYKEEQNSFRNESNPNPNFFTKIFDNQIKNPFEKKSLKEARLDKNLKNYLKKNVRNSSQNQPGHYRSQSMNVLF